jgi:hypothetical protein
LRTITGTGEHRLITTLDTRRREIRRRAEAGHPLARIEAEVIDRAQWLGPEDRSALWLWAWHCCEGDLPVEAVTQTRMPGAA